MLLGRGRRDHLTHEEYLRTRNFSGLDGLRAIAATIVVIFHFGGPVVHRLQGWVGVQIFFVLSGYLITTLALREVDRTGRLDFRGFYLRRLFRIAPAYLVVLAVVVLQSELNDSGERELRAALPYYLTFLNDIAPRATYVHTWTLGVEQKFYLLWPLLAFGLARQIRGRILVALATIAVFVPLIDFRQVHSASYVVLLLGALLAIVLHHPRGFALLRPLLAPGVSTALAGGYLVFHLAFTGLLDRFGEQRMIPFYGMAVCLLMPAVIGPGPVRWVLSRRPMVFVGQRSYAVYLVQFVAGSAALGLFPATISRQSPVTAVIVLVISVLFADLLYRWVEQPMIRLGKRVAARPDPRGSEKERPNLAAAKDGPGVDAPEPVRLGG